MQTDGLLKTMTYTTHYKDQPIEWIVEWHQHTDYVEMYVFMKHYINGELCLNKDVHDCWVTSSTVKDLTETRAKDYCHIFANTCSVFHLDSEYTTTGLVTSQVREDGTTLVNTYNRVSNRQAVPHGFVTTYDYFFDNNKIMGEQE